MMVHKFKIILLLLFLLLLSRISGLDDANAAGSVYYLDQNHPQAADQAGHGSIDEPWKSPAYAFDRLKPGDTLLIREGMYSNERIKLDASNRGNSEAPITVKPYPDERVVFSDGKDITMNGAEWWVFDGLIFTGFSGQMIFQLGKPENITAHITIRNCIFRDSKAEPISLLYATDILIENNEFLRINTRRAGSPSHGIDILSWGKRVTIRNNKFVDIAADGIHLGATTGPVIEDILITGNEFGITNHEAEWGENGVDVKEVDGPIQITKNYFYGFRPTETDGVGHKGDSHGTALVLHLGAQQVWVAGNMFEDNTTGLAIGDQQELGYPPTRNIRVENNIFKDSLPYEGSANRPPGLGRALNINGVRDIETMEIYHNTFVNNALYLSTSKAKAEAVFRNNAIWGGKAAISSESNIIASNNAWSETEGEIPETLKGPGDLRSLSNLKLDSQFRPHPTSRLVNGGVEVGVEKDFEDKPRTDGRPDIGAFELIVQVDPREDDEIRLYLPVLIKSGQM